MKRQTLRLTISTVVAVAADFMPIPGLLGAALLFPQGIEGDYAYTYLALALCLNSAIFFGATYLIFGLLTRNRASGERTSANP